MMPAISPLPALAALGLRRDTAIGLCRHVCPRCGGCDICCADPYGCRNDDQGDDE